MKRSLLLLLWATAAVAQTPATTCYVAGVHLQQAVENTDPGRLAIKAAKDKLKTQWDEVYSLDDQIKKSSDLHDKDLLTQERSAKYDIVQTAYTKELTPPFRKLAQDIYVEAKSMAQAHGCKVLLNYDAQGAGGILWLSDIFDITPAVVDSYNRKQAALAKK